MLLGLDVGGTFTDAVIIDGHRVVASAKRRTTKDNLMQGIGEALDAISNIVILQILIKLRCLLLW